MKIRWVSEADPTKRKSCSGTRTRPQGKLDRKPTTSFRPKLDSEMARQDVKKAEREELLKLRGRAVASHSHIKF